MHMDHGSGASTNTTTESHMSMHMTFYGGQKAVILFDQWTTTTWGYYILSLLALFVIAFLYQYLQYRLTLMAQTCSSPPYAGSLFIRILHSSMFTFAVAVAYFLMLAVMTFNAGIFIVVTLGFGFGFFFFHTNNNTSSTIAAATSSTLTPKVDLTCCA
mgnify:FL=1